MKLRWLELTTATHGTRNAGSNRYPHIRPTVETAVEKTLQFSEDGGVTWQNVEIEYEFVTRDSR